MNDHNAYGEGKIMSGVSVMLFAGLKKVLLIHGMIIKSFGLPELFEKLLPHCY